MQDPQQITQISPGPSWLRVENGAKVKDRTSCPITLIYIHQLVEGILLTWFHGSPRESPEAAAAAAAELETDTYIPSSEEDERKTIGRDASRGSDVPRADSENQAPRADVLPPFPA